MDFSIYSVNNIAEKTLLDYLINIAGMIIIPLVIYFLSSVYQEGEKIENKKYRYLIVLHCIVKIYFKKF